MENDVIKRDLQMRTQILKYAINPISHGGGSIRPPPSSFLLIIPLKLMISVRNFLTFPKSQLCLLRKKISHLGGCRGRQRSVYLGDLAREHEGFSFLLSQIHIFHIISPFFFSMLIYLFKIYIIVHILGNKICSENSTSQYITYYIWYILPFNKTLKI